MYYKQLNILLAVVVFSLSFFVHISRAEDCMHDAIYEKGWSAVVTTGVRIRDIPCMESSVVLATAPVGEVLHVIAETDGYYKIERKDGTVGWIGQWLVAKTNQSFVKDNAPKEPLFDIVNHPYGSAIRYLANKNIVQGYPDMSYKPDSTINRAEFTKIVAEAQFDPGDINDCVHNFSLPGLNYIAFPDIPLSAWFASYVCMAKDEGIIGGYPDGYFRPSNEVNFVEASKILVEVFGLDKKEGDYKEWYRPYVEALQNNSYIPKTIDNLDKKITRGEMAEMIWRIMEEEHTLPFSQLI